MVYKSYLMVYVYSVDLLILSYKNYLVLQIDQINPI